jgi:hypothetical protein
MAFSNGSNRRFSMSAMKPIAWGILLAGALASSVKADPITWPSGLENWVVYLAAPTGQASPIPVATYSAPVASTPAVTAPVASTPVVTAPVPAVSQAPAAAPVSQPAPIQVAVTPPAPSQPVVSVPTPTPAPVSTPVSPVMPAVTAAPVVSPQVTMAATAPAAMIATPSTHVNAFVNLGTGPYTLASSITTGNALPWYDSTKIAGLFGGQPTAQQIQSFDNAVIQQVQHTFASSGISVSLTTNPGVAAGHTLSLVSNTAAAALPSAIGMTQLGASGFSFIDQIAPSAQNVGQLELIVAHNISHELMLSFGVGEQYDQTGNYIDARMANWSMMVSPTATFSPAAAQAINQALATQADEASNGLLGAQVLGSPSPVPEPSTVALWTMAACGLIIYQRRRPKGKE